MGGKVEGFATSDRVTVLLQALDNQMSAIEAGENREHLLFQWATSLLLAAFGVVVALADSSRTLRFPFVIKSLASVLVTVPLFLTIVWIFRRSRRSANNAEAVERIEKALHLFEQDYYGTDSPYPQEWEGMLVQSRQRRKTPLYYALVLGLMAICVVAAIWLAL
jgi:hypothetical protein